MNAYSGRSILGRSISGRSGGQGHSAPFDFLTRTLNFDSPSESGFFLCAKRKLNDSRYCGAKRRTACKGLGQSFRAVFHSPALTRRVRQTDAAGDDMFSQTGVAMESRQPFGRYGSKTSRKLWPVSASRFVMVRAWRRLCGSSRISLSLILSRENRRTRALATAMNVAGAAEFSGFVSAVVELFSTGSSPHTASY